MRPVTPGDAASVARLHNQRRGREWTEAGTRELLEIPAIRGLIDDGVGYVLISVTDEEAEVVDIAVDESKRGQGFGERLLYAALPATPVFLEVAVDNPAAFGLYEKLGFRQIGLRPNYYARGTHAVDAIVMRRDPTFSPR